MRRGKKIVSSFRQVPTLRYYRRASWFKYNLFSLFLFTSLSSSTFPSFDVWFFFFLFRRYFLRWKIFLLTFFYLTLFCLLDIEYLNVVNRKFVLVILQIYWCFKSFYGLRKILKLNLEPGAQIVFKEKFLKKDSDPPS